MAQRSKREEARDEDQSLIPAIKEREARLAEMLERKRAECEASVREAEAAAERRIAAARDESARSAESRRKREAEAVEAEVVELRQGLERRVAAVAATAERNHARAVSALLDVVRGKKDA
jgi:hypothetical protein